MPNYRFRLELAPLEMTPELADAVYTATDGDVEFGVLAGVPELCFDRSAPDFHLAVASAVRQAQKCGLTVLALTPGFEAEGYDPAVAAQVNGFLPQIVYYPVRYRKLFSFPAEYVERLGEGIGEGIGEAELTGGSILKTSWGRRFTDEFVAQKRGIDPVTRQHLSFVYMDGAYESVLQSNIVSDLIPELKTQMEEAEDWKDAMEPESAAGDIVGNAGMRQ